MTFWNLKVIVSHAQTFKCVLLFEMFCHEHIIMHVIFRVPCNFQWNVSGAQRRIPLAEELEGFLPIFQVWLAGAPDVTSSDCNQFEVSLSCFWFCGFCPALVRTQRTSPWGLRDRVGKAHYVLHRLDQVCLQPCKLRGTPVVPIKVAHFRMIMGAAWTWRSLTCWGNKSGTLWWEHLFQPNCQRPQLTFSHILSLRAVFHPNGPSAVY